MHVEFQSGETFDGPWADDPAIAGSVIAYRRINIEWVETTDRGTERVKSAAFQPHRDSNSISVTLSDVAESMEVEVEAMALGAFTGQYGLAAVAVGDARGIGFLIRRVPLSVDPGHAMMFAAHPASGDCPNDKQCRKLGRELARLARVALSPP